MRGTMHNDPREIRHALRLTTQSSRLRKQPCLRSLDVRQLVDEVLVQLSEPIECQNICVNVDVPAHARLLADDAMLRTSLFDLVLNAIDAMPDGGDLVITAVSDTSGLELEIADSGPGLGDPKSIMQNILPGAREVCDRLTAAQEIAAVHGGFVTASNCPEGGAAYTLYLPTRAIRAAA